MTVKNIDDSYLTAIADAIRSKNGSTESYSIHDMPAAIRSLADVNDPYPYWTPEAQYFDGYSHVFVTVDDATAVSLSLVGTGTIDWGDGTTTACEPEDEEIHAYEHTYSSAGDYDIKTSQALIWTGSSSMPALTASAGTVAMTQALLVAPKVGKYAFRQVTTLKNVYIQNAESVDGSAFRSCKNLESAVLPVTLTSIGFAAFGYGCPKLRSLVIPDGVTNIDSSAFYDSGIECLTLPSSIQTLEPSFCQGCKKLQFIRFPKIETDSDEPFYPSGDPYYDVSELGLLNLAQGLDLSNCSNLEKIDLSSVYCSSRLDLSDCTNLEEIIFCKYGSYIYDASFRCCESLMDIKLPSYISGLAGGCFQGCSLLRFVDLPAYLQQIENDAFCECPNLDTIVLRAVNPPFLSGEIFGGHDENGEEITLPSHIYVPDDALDDYRNDSSWSAYADSLQAISTWAGYVPDEEEYE